MSDAPSLSGFTCPTFSMHARNFACAWRSCAYEFDRWASSCGDRSGQDACVGCWEPEEANLFELATDVCELRDVEVGHVDLLR